MKTLNVAFLVALMCVIAQAQNRSMADATYALKGPVRTYRLETATFVNEGSSYVEGPRVLLSEASFNEDGNRTDLRMYNDKGVLVRRIVMKFEGRRMIEAINYDGNGKMWMRTVDQYDEEGRTKGSMTYDGEGSLISTSVIKRNSRGLVTELTKHSSKGVLLEQMNRQYDGPKMISQERKVYYPNGSLQLHSVWDGLTRRSEHTTYRTDGSVQNRTVRDNWDTAQYGGDGSLQKITAFSEEHRLTADEITIDKGQPATRESERPDEVDAHGNWTKQTRWLTDAKGTRPLKVTYRALTYY